jgi:hypothetical protein
MTHQEQERRRQLKQQRRHLDSIAQAIAAAAPRKGEHAPSTRAKQARWHHEAAANLLRRRAEYDQLRADMTAIARELARKPEPPTER